ncbi:MAG TPA: serine hydrolase domain-containing protein [Gammaproteobacteria bacterium]
MPRFLPILLLALLPLAPVRAADAPAPPQDLESLKAQLTRLMQDAGVPGAGVALFGREGVTWTAGLGYADLAAKKAVTPDTLFRVGSITKSFTAVALLQLAEHGAINLDARLKDIAPEVPVANAWDKTDPVTVAEVLEHTAGFDDMHFPRLYNFHEPPDLPLLTVLERSAPELKVRWRPGTRMSYSNPDYLVAGYLIEKVSGERYARYVTEHVLRPLGLAHASLALDAATRAGLAQGYIGTPEQPVEPAQIYLRPAGALAASPAELANLGVLLLDRGQWRNAPFLSAASVTRMETPRTSLAARHGLDYGYGFADYSSYIGGYLFHGHDGGIDGFVSRYAYAPDEGVGFVLLVNTSSPGRFMRQASELITAYLMRDQPKPLPAVGNADPQQLGRLEGFYRAGNPRNQVLAGLDWLLDTAEVELHTDGQLTYSPLIGGTEPLGPVGLDLWARGGDPGPSAVSYVEDGREVLDFGSSGGWMVKTSRLAARGPLWLLGLALLAMLSSVVMAPVWLVRMLSGQMRGLRHWEVRLLPLAAVTAFAFMLGGAVSVQPMQLGSVNVHTVIFYLGSVLFALLSLAACVQALRSFGWEMNRWARWQALAAAVACLGVAAFLGHWGLIGLRMWNF